MQVHQCLGVPGITSLRAWEPAGSCHIPMAVSSSSPVLEGPSEGTVFVTTSPALCPHPIGGGWHHWASPSPSLVIHPHILWHQVPTRCPLESYLGAQLPRGQQKGNIRISHGTRGVLTLGPLWEWTLEGGSSCWRL